MADDLCVEADGGWLSSTADLLTLLPAVLRLRDTTATGGHRVHVGCAGGIGTPEAAGVAFLLGADFVLTGSVNQCSVEAATSAEVKDILQEAREYDVDTAPWGELFDLGVQARYLKRGLFFPARASRLHELWRRRRLARPAGRRDQEPGSRPVPGRRGARACRGRQYPRAATGGCVPRLLHTRFPPRRER